MHNVISANFDSDFVPNLKLPKSNRAVKHRSHKTSETTILKIHHAKTPLEIRNRSN